jgi:hypothetical protein
MLSNPWRQGAKWRHFRDNVAAQRKKGISMSSYSPRPIEMLVGNPVLPTVGPRVEKGVTLDADARPFLTDLTQMRAFVTADTTQIDAALEKMVQCGVRLLFVIDAESRLVGLVTSVDIVSEKPMLVIQKRDGQFSAGARAQLRVADVMAPVANWRVLDFSKVERARVGDILATFEREGLRHLLVIERIDAGRPMVRGLFSATEFERILGIRITQGPKPSSFAEVESALAHPR